MSDLELNPYWTIKKQLSDIIEEGKQKQFELIWKSLIHEFHSDLMKLKSLTEDTN